MVNFPISTAEKLKFPVQDLLPYKYPTPTSNSSTPNKLYTKQRENRD